MVLDPSPRVLVLLFLTVLFTSSIGTAQRTWIVDAANGPGTDFTDLPTANAMAANGDILVLRPGDYYGLIAARPLTILGTPGATRILAVSPTEPYVALFGVRAGETFAMRDVILGPGRNPILAPGFTCRNCAGTVLLDGVDAGPDFSTLRFENCARVLITRSGHASPRGLTIHALASAVTVTGSALLGRHANGAVNACPGIFLERGSRLVVGDSVAVGGQGWVMVLPTRTDVRIGAAGIEVSDSTIEVARAVSVASGVTPLPGYDTPAIGGRGQATIDWTAQLLPTGTAPAVSPHLAVHRIDRPVLRSRGSAATGRWDLTLESTPNQVFWIGVGLPTAPRATALGELWFEFAQSVTVGVGVQGANGATSVAFAIPPGGPQRGLALAAHALAGDFVASFGLTPPALWILP